MKRLLCAVMCIVVTASALVLAGCGGNNASSGSEAADSSASEPATVNIESFMIETPYGMLKLPADWSDKIKIETKNDKEVFTVKASFANTPLFDIAFNGKDGELLGTVTGEGNKKVEVRYKKYGLDKNSDNYDELVKYQGGVEIISENLAKNDNFTKAG